jgi:hypothetical protein
VTAAVAQAFECEHCEDRRAVDSPTLGVIRCPRCTRREVKRDASGLEQITREEAERREQLAIDAGRAKPQTGLACTIALLQQWGRFVRENGIGYPSMSTTEKARVGRGYAEKNSAFPPDLEAIDAAVCKAPIDYKTILVEHYTKFGYVYEKAGRLSISRQTYYQRKASAERHVANAIGL